MQHYGFARVEYFANHSFSIKIISTRKRQKIRTELFIA